MRTTKNVLRSLVLAAVTAIGLAGGCEQPPKATSAVAVRPSITIFPVAMAGEPRADIARVAALMLEQRGMESIEVDETAFAPGATTSFTEQAAGFAAFVARRGVSTDYALYGAVLGSPQDGVDEIRSVLVTRDGEVVWTDRQTRESRAMKRAGPEDPMSSTLFLVDRLAPPLALLDPDDVDASEGRWARTWQSDSLHPSDDEQAAMDRRLAAARAAGPDVTVLVYPPRTGETWSLEGAQRLADEINRRGLMRATAAPETLAFDAEPSSNQQRTLWSGARSIQDLLRAHPADTDYVLCTDDLMGGGHVGGVHTFLLDAQGDWVLVDFQNAHHDDFIRVDPASIADCATLSVVRLERALDRR